MWRTITSNRYNKFTCRIIEDERLPEWMMKRGWMALLAFEHWFYADGVRGSHNLVLILCRIKCLSQI
jgi:hypothetical protein